MCAKKESISMTNRSEKQASIEKIGKQKPHVSPSVIKRLPRYFRYLRILIREGKSRISSSELSGRMNVTASQIRQDLNCFGGFGQQGYGYNVNYLYANICELLGVGAGLHAVIIGAGNLGKALVGSTMFEKRGVDVIALFDTDPALVGTSVDEIPIYSIDSLGEFCENNAVDMAVLTLPKEAARATAALAVKHGVKGFWNFTSEELALGDDVIIENVHLGDSLMTLSYRLCSQNENTETSDT